MAERKGVFERLLRLDRRIIFVLIALAVVAPLVVPLDLPVQVSEPVQMLYDAIEELPPGGRPILVDVDYDPSTMPELGPMTLTVIHHCMSRGVPVVVLTLHPAGFGLAKEALETVAARFPNAEYGKDFALLGYNPGGGIVVMGIGQDFHATYPKDSHGTPTSELQILKNVKNYDDIEMVVGFHANAWYELWIIYAYTRYGCRVGSGVTAVMAADAYPYLKAGQLVGLLGGLSGAAEYEKLIDQRGTATIGMDAQSVVHILIIILIILGNIAYFATRRKRRVSGAAEEVTE